MSLRKKFKKILEDSYSEITYPETLNALFEAIKELLPEKIDKTLSGMRGEGWNDCLTEMIRRREE